VKVIPAVIKTILSHGGIFRLSTAARFTGNRYTYRL